MHNLETLQLLKQIRRLHANFTLVSRPGLNLLDLNEEWLAYLLKTLRGEIPETNPIPPSAWGSIMDILDDHKILPLMYSRLRSFPDISRPPDEVLQQFRAAYRRSIIKNIHREQQLVEVLDMFNGNGIRVIVLKGSALALYLYPDPALRSGIDIDLLVNKDNMLLIRSLLKNMGYNCLDTSFDKSVEGNCEEIYVHKNSWKNMTIEVHWSLSPYSSVNRHLDIDKLFDRAVGIETAGRTIEVLDNVDAIIHAANHMIYNHNRNIRLNWIYDIALLCNSLKSPGDWSNLQKRSVESGARLSLEESIKMAQCWTGLKIPYGFDDFSKWPAPTPEEIETFSLISDGSTLSLTRLMMPGSGTIIEKIKYLFRLLFPSRNIVRACYPPSQEWLLPLSYIKRWIRWIKRLHF